MLVFTLISTCETIFKVDMKALMLPQLTSLDVFITISVHVSVSFKYLKNQK